MTERFRTGGSWGVTLIETGSGEPDTQGRREGDRLVAVVMGGAVVTSDRELAERVAWLLNHAETDDDPEFCVAVGCHPQHHTADPNCAYPDGVCTCGEPEGHSCTCDYRPGWGCNPDCPVHHGSGRDCPRHGAVI